MPQAYQLGLNHNSPERDLALNKGQMLSLRSYLQEHFEDPRRNNRTYPASSLLVFIAMALFAGRDNLAAIVRYGGLLTSSNAAGSTSRLKKAPTSAKHRERALRNFLTKIDPKDFARCLSGWLGSNLGELPRALAVDGKWIRDKALSLCLSDHETGAPVAIGFAAEAPKTDTNKREGEQSVALQLYEQSTIEGATITGDALNNNRAQANAIIESGGDYFLQLKNENRHAYQAALRSTRASSPFTYTQEPDTTHGRFDQRTVKVYPFEPLEANLPGCRSLAVIERTRTTDPDETCERAFFTTSHPPQKGCAKYFLELSTGHWAGSEIRNHWVRDHCMREDKTRSKNYKLNCALAALRTCLITIKSITHPHLSWPALQERCQRDPSIAFQAIAKLKTK